MDMGRFLCRDEAERRRITDVGRALRPGIPVLIVFFVVAGLSGVGSYGWQALLPTAIAIAAYAVLWVLNMPRRGRPEFAYAGAFVLAELMLALSIIVGQGIARQLLRRPRDAGAVHFGPLSQAGRDRCGGIRHGADRSPSPLART